METKKTILGLIDEAITAGARLKSCCKHLGISKRTIERWRKDLRGDGRKNNRFTVSNALSPEERRKVLDICCLPEYRDLSPNQIVPRLADKGEYIASESTLYRLLRQKGMLTPRSRTRAPHREKPDELTATGPNQVWCWDVTYLLRGLQGAFFYLYMVIDIYDRTITAWRVHEEHTGEVAADLFREACEKHGIRPEQLISHSDNGSPMISVDFLAVADALKFALSYSRPGVSDDNPFIESHFRTLKYRPSYPGRFATIEEAIAWVTEFVEWYSNIHLHSGIGFVTPMQRRLGEDVEILAGRRSVYEEAKKAHPNRWSGNTRKWERPESVTLNPRTKKQKKSAKKKEAA